MTGMSVTSNSHGKFQFSSKAREVVSQTHAAPQRERSKSKPQVAYDYLRARIERGEFAPRARLLPGEIALELGCSVVPVREAIQRLTAEGIATIEHNMGARLALFDAAAYSQGMEALAMLDGMATALAAPHVTPAQFERATDINRQLAEILDAYDPKAFSVLNSEFHETLCLQCPNKRVSELASTERARFANLRDARHFVSVERAVESVNEHTHLLDLINSGAPANDIEHAARDHVLATLHSWLLQRV